MAITKYNEMIHKAPKNESEREFLQGKIEVLQGQLEMLEPRLAETNSKTLYYQTLENDVLGNMLAIERIEKLLS